MVTYRNRDPEPSVRFRPPHPVFKVLAVLFCCVQLLAVPAMAADEVWETASVSTFNAVLSQSSVQWTDIVERVWRDPESATPDSIMVDNGSEPWYQGGLAGSSLTWYKEISGLPAKYDTTENSRYVDYHSVPSFTINANQVRFSTTVVLEPGYYEIDFGSVFTTYTSTDNTTHPANTYSWYFVGSSGATVVPFYSSDKMRQYVELTEASRLYLNVSYPPFTIDNTFTYTPNEEHPNSLLIYFNLYNPNLRYRSLDPVDLAALDQANTDSGNTITDYDNVEQQWTGSMSENFAQLNVGGFSFGNGLISGFGLVSDLFMKVWTALGSYSIVYTFPLYLGIILVLTGRLNRFIGHLDRKGDNDA